jgi:alcohol dehydrogenase, propanol-preferring
MLEMMAARIVEFNQSLQVMQVPIPEIESKEVLVKVRAASLCGTDLHIIEGHMPAIELPVTLGHEIAGTISQVGSEVKGFTLGDRVCMSGLISCGNCFYCQEGMSNLCYHRKSLGFDIDGGFADYVKIPASNVFLLPNSISFAEGAILTDALATSYHAMQQANISGGETVAILGIGGVGAVAIQTAKALGARVIALDRKKSKLDLAKSLGAGEIVDLNRDDLVRAVRELTDGKGVDAAFETTGSARVLQAGLTIVRRGGAVVLIALSTEPVPVVPFILGAKEIKLMGSCAINNGDFPKLIEMVHQELVDLKKCITHRFPLEEINKAIEILRTKEGDPLRIVIEFRDNDRKKII